MKKKFPVHVSAETLASIKAQALVHGCSLGEAADRLVLSGVRRLAASRRYDAKTASAPTPGS